MLLITYYLLVRRVQTLQGLISINCCIRHIMLKNSCTYKVAFAGFLILVFAHELIHHLGDKMLLITHHCLVRRVQGFILTAA